ncbi:MAG: DNA repair protein RadA [Proteobacteria bacterium]|nr:DNA repair protein RadA [Pseudomonadota bacterium]MBU1739448.1 DNA repair protein RadA [Pseudomonadota bacterium]
MAKDKTTIFMCGDCGADFGRWMGQCPECNAWDTIKEARFSATKAKPAKRGYAGERSEVKTMAEVDTDSAPRFATGFNEFDRVLGGGVVPGSVVLIGGDPGVGKSTILLQICCRLAEKMKVLYVTGEESLQQITMRARRLELPEANLLLLAETGIEEICEAAVAEQPRVVVIDSIQTMQSPDSNSAPGSVSQVRDSAARLTAFAKQSNTAFFLIGHVTKTGDLAGPRVLEHIIDVVCYIEGSSDSRFRIMRAVKNRYGAVNELGVYAMTDKGLKEVTNPSAIFLSRQDKEMPGSAVMVIWEGSRPMLVEIQALADDSYGENPRRVTLGLDYNRLSMLLAVLHRHGNVATYNKDIFVNVVGGIKVMETGADLPLLLAVVSSLKGKSLPVDLVAFGEAGLAGEIRPVPGGQERLREAAKHGFRKAIVPKANAPKKQIAGLEVLAVSTLREALDAL